jgi:hypothetical protein
LKSGSIIEIADLYEEFKDYPKSQIDSMILSKIDNSNYAFFACGDRSQKTNLERHTYTLKMREYIRKGLKGINK